MNLELKALYNLHKYQIILNARGNDGNYRFPESYLYAVAHDVYPYWDDNWCNGVDPYKELYKVDDKYMSEVISYVDDIWLKKMGDSSIKIPTFYELESNFGGRSNRYKLITLFRYTFLNGGFKVNQNDDSFYKELLKPTQYPTEAGGICKDFTDDELLLV